MVEGAAWKALLEPAPVRPPPGAGGPRPVVAPGSGTWPVPHAHQIWRFKELKTVGNPGGVPTYRPNNPGADSSW